MSKFALYLVNLHRFGEAEKADSIEKMMAELRAQNEMRAEYARMKIDDTLEFAPAQRAAYVEELIHRNLLKRDDPEWKILRYMFGPGEILVQYCDTYNPDTKTCSHMEAPSGTR
jgi:hypothetical protein